MATATDIKPRDPNNVDSELSPADLNLIPPARTQEEVRFVDLTMERFNASAENRRPFEPMVFESFAFYLGNQYVTWNAGSKSLMSQRTPRSPHKTYEQRNKIRPKVKKLLARGLRNKPVSTVAPDTPSAKNRAAAMLGRSLVAHWNQAFEDNARLWRMARWACTTSTCYDKPWWNPFAFAEVPTYDPSGQIDGGSTLSQVGEICHDIVPWFEAYPDPQAREYDELTWFIHAKERSIEEVKRKYPETGWWVAGDQAGQRGNVETRMASVVGGYARGSEPGGAGKTVTVYEVHEKPTLAYPAGRWWTVAGDRVVKPVEDLPKWLMKPDGSWDLPFNPLSYETGQGTVHGLNAVWDLVGAQRAYNNAVSRISEHIRCWWGKILAPMGSQITTSAFDSGKEGEVIYYSLTAGKPEHLPPPALPTFTLESIKVNNMDLDDISGVHEISEGGVPSGVTAAAAIRLLLDSDVTQMADFTNEIETFVCRRDNMRLRMAKAYYKEPRLIFASQTANTGGQGAVPIPGASNGPVGPLPPQPPGMPGQTAGAGPQGAPGEIGPQGPPQSPMDEGDDVPSPLMQVASFEALAAGSCRVVVTPGSATPKSPEAKFEEVIKLAQVGVVGPLGDPTTAGIILGLLDYANPDEVVEAMEQARAKALAIAAAHQPDPHAAMLAKLQMEQEHEQMVEALRTHGTILVMQAKREIDAETSALNLSNQMKMAMLLARLKNAHVNKSIGATVKLGETAGPSAEEAMNLRPDSGAQLRQLNTPQRPAVRKDPAIA